MRSYDKEKPKRRILYAAVELLSQGEELTIRKIALRAGVGTGLINYHFQNREKLINEAVRLFLREEVVPSGFESLSTQTMDPVEKLKTACRGGFGYFAYKPEISKTALLFDLKDPHEGDTIAKGMELFLPLIREAAGPGADEEKMTRALWLLIGGVQLAFLRASLFKNETGVDYFHQKERDEWIDQTVDALITMLRVKETAENE